MTSIGIGYGIGLDSFIGGGAPWTPADMVTALWLDASDLSTITSSVGAVSQWRDKSGNNRHANQGAGANQPTSGTRTVNGLNVLDFDGTSDYMITGANAALDRTLAFVSSYDDPSGGSIDVVIGARDSSNERSYVGQQGGFNKMGAGSFGTTNGNTLPASPNIQVHTHSSGLKLNAWVNGIKDTVYDDASFTGPIGSIQPYYIGTLNDGGSPNSGLYHNGPICEIVLTYDVISTEERLLLQEYMLRWIV